MAALGLSNGGAWAQSSETGRLFSSFFRFDREIQKFMSARNIPGGAVAVVKDRRLVYARGYGWADRENQVPVKPSSLFRIASVTKPFTATAALRLVEEGKMDLSSRVFDLLTTGPDAFQAPRGELDKRWKQIAVRHLLQHTGGWDRDKSFDPMFRSREIARTIGVASPPGPRDIVRYMLGQPLDFDPGSRYVYSNFGYCVLGRLIEKITGLSYEKFVQDIVLAPLGIRRMRIGGSLAEKRADGEVRYYMAQDETAESVFDDFPSPGSALPVRVNSAGRPLDPSGQPDNAGQANPTSPKGTSKESEGKRVSWPYGGFCLESMDAHGGWIASVVDLARFMAAFHDSDRALLNPETMRMMYAPPDPPVWRSADGSMKDHYYGCGWMVRPVPGKGGANYWHTGSLPGTCSLLVRRWDGVSWVVLFNQRSDEDKRPDNEIDAALHRAAHAVTEWPKYDLFAQYRGG